jgi:pyruvate dehydrogenase E2 component (dihydrolipoamide acetyltransferase)
MPIEIYLPKMSDHMESGTITRWLVKAGEPVRRGQVLLEIETDKAVGEIEAPADGILSGIRAVEGTVVPVGQALAFILQPGEALPVQPEPGALFSQAAQPASSASAETHDERSPHDPAAGGIVPATPVARRIARELEVDLRQVRGSGPDGRVTEEDVRSFARDDKKR